MSNLDAKEMVRAAHEFASRMASDAATLDWNPEFVAHHYRGFQRRGLNAIGSVQSDLDASEHFEILATLAEASGTFAVLALDNFLANRFLGDEGWRPWPCVGVATEGLRRRAGLDWEDGRASGSIPWVAGVGVFTHAVVGMNLTDGREAYALVDLANRPGFQHSEPLPLIAGVGARPVRVEVVDLEVPAARFLRLEPPGASVELASRALLWRGALIAGVIRGLVKSIKAAEVEAATRVGIRAAALEADLRAAVVRGATDRAPEILTRVGDFGLRLARLAVMAAGQGGLDRNHPSPRRVRELLLLSGMTIEKGMVDESAEALS